jgi:outer membrane protein
MKKLLFLVSFIAVSFSVLAQKQWSLQDCLNYAQENNLDIKRAFLGVESSKKNLFQSKASMLPTLNGSVSETRSYGRNYDSVIDQIVSDNIKSNNFGISSSVSLFNGFQKINTIRKNNYDYLASKYDAQRIANNISINIVTAYLQVMYNKEQVSVSQEKFDLSVLQLERIKSMVEVGQLPQGSLLESEAQLAQEELALVNSNNQLDISLLNIKQLLDLKNEDQFDIIYPEIEPSVLTKTNSIQMYEQAVINLPDVKQADNNLKSAQRSLAISQGARSPRISLSTNWGTAYSDARMLFAGLDSQGNPLYTDYPFKDQFEDNSSQSVTVSLSLPLFNGWQANNSISQARINVKQFQLNLQQTKNQLRKTIEQAQADAIAANKQYLASLKSVEALTESFRYTESKYNVQLINSYEYFDAKNKLYSSENSLLQAKYDYIFKLKMLDFYMGKKLNF